MRRATFLHVAKTSGSALQEHPAVMHRSAPLRAAARAAHRGLQRDCHQCLSKARPKSDGFPHRLCQHACSRHSPAHFFVCDAHTMQS
jgi:thiamine phosphate synthase YjbQ (UPF0047 family)